MLNITYPRIAGEYGAPPVDYNSEWTAQALQDAVVANEGNLVVVTLGKLRADGQVEEYHNVVGTIIKGTNNYEIHRSIKDAHLTLFFITHANVDKIVEPIPMTGHKYVRVVRFAVWAQKCREAGLAERNRMITEFTAMKTQVECLQAQTTALQTALAAKGGREDKTILKRASGEPSMANLDGWKEFLTDPGQIDALMNRLDVCYKQPDDAEKRTARENLRTALVSALNIDTPDWTQEQAGLMVHNLLCAYRVVMSVPVANRESVFAKMEPQHSDPLGNLIQKVTASKSGFAKKGKKCFNCGKVGHNASECYSKKSGSKNARKEE